MCNKLHKSYNRKSYTTRLNTGQGYWSLIIDKGHGISLYLMLCLSACSSLLIIMTSLALMCRTLILTLLEAEAIFPAYSDGIFMLRKIACNDCNPEKCNEPEDCGQTPVNEGGALTATQWTNACPHWAIVRAWFALAAWWAQMSLSLRRHTWPTSSWNRNTNMFKWVFTIQKTLLYSKYELHWLHRQCKTV